MQILPYLRHVVFLFVTGMFCLVANAQDAALNKELDQLQAKDDLEEWLYARMDYAAKQPAARLSFLMATQQAAWRQPRNDHERLAWLDLHTYQGYYQLYTGHIIPSIQAYETAYRYYYDDPVPDTDVMEFILMPLGNNYTRLGDYERAQFIHAKSLGIAQERKDARGIAGACSNLAVAAQMQEQYAEAKRYALLGLQSAPAASSIAGLLHATLADIYYATNAQDSARLHANEAITILRKAPPAEENRQYWLSSAYQVAGNIAARTQHQQEALQAYGQALQTLDKGRKRERARLLVKTGTTFLQMQQAAKGLQQFDEALELLLPGYTRTQLPDTARLYGEFMLIDAMEGKARALLQQGNRQLALQYLVRTFVVERKLRREFFSRATRMLHQQQSRSLAETAMELCYDLYRQTNNYQYAASLLEIAEMSKVQTLMEELYTNLQYSKLQSKDSLLVKQRRLMQAIAYYEREAALQGSKTSPQENELSYELSLLQEQIKEKYPTLYLRSANTRLTADSICRQIPEGTLVKEFFAGNQYLFIIELDNKGIRQVERLDSGAAKQQQIRTFVTRYFRNGPQAMINAPDKYYEEAYAICKWIWPQPVTTKRCLVIPDGWVGYLPFEALVTSPQYIPNIDRWPFLLYQAPIGLAYSLESWLQQQQQPVQEKSPVTGFFIARNAKGGPPIPAVEKEYEAVSKRAQGKYYREDAASLASFRSVFSQASILHLGTHAALQGDQALPLLELADGKFFLFELYGLRFHPQLVVLSACRTGDGMLAEGEGIISLAREFTASGAGGIVAGLWNVHDAAAAGLTGSFYQHLEKAESPLTALHLAKIDWLKEKHDNQLLKLPYYWAALNYIGHHHAVTILAPKPRNPLIYWLEAAVLTILAGSLGWWYTFRHKRQGRQLRNEMKKAL